MQEWCEHTLVERIWCTFCGAVLSVTHALQVFMVETIGREALTFPLMALSIHATQPLAPSDTLLTYPLRLFKEGGGGFFFRGLLHYLIGPRPASVRHTHFS